MAFIGAIAGVLLLLFAASVDAQAAVTLRWTKTYNGSDVGQCVAVAADGSIYVTGTTYVASLSPAPLLRKYSPSGALLPGS